MKNYLKRILPVLFAVFTLFTAASCQTDPYENRDLTLAKLRDYMIEETDGRFLTVMKPYTVHAESGFSLLVANRQVAFYKYNPNLEGARRKMEYIDNNGFIFFAGNRRDAIRNGVFVMVDYKANEEAALLLEKFMAFGKPEQK